VWGRRDWALRKAKTVGREKQKGIDVRNIQCIR